MKKTILLIDIISHETMHIPFNEGYIRTMRSAFPDDEIIFAATAGHIDNMDQNLTEEFNIKMVKIPNLRDLLKGKSPHSPFFSLPAAKKCWSNVQTLAQGRSIRLASILGSIGPVIHTFSRKWNKSYSGELHFIQHDQFARVNSWRSKNPIIKYFDYLSVLRRGLPERQKLIVLELGLKEMLSKYAPKLIPSILTIEHPVLESEWLLAKPFNSSEPINVGFVGHCGKGKGFDKFLSLAEKFSGDKYKFFAIGKSNIRPEDNLSLQGLTVLPSDGYLPRKNFIDLLNQIDIICLPLPVNQSFVSSGSIIDAFAGLKPLIITENQSLNAIQDKYGEFGKIVKNQDELDTFFDEFSAKDFIDNMQKWQSTLKNIRKFRSEKELGKVIAQEVK
tara:strand:+ start:4194 stop:5360 length:1167 start_codon:yes stop_codon:yes gene_type:complete